MLGKRNVYAAKAKRIIVVLLLLSVFAIASMMPACSSDPATAGMIAYGNGTELTIPKYRLWNGSAWGDQCSANDVVGEINMVVLRSARTRDEKILGVLDKNGDINVQVWNGTTWGSVLEVTTAIDFNYRGFDIAYEDSSGDAIIVYQNNTNDPLYRVWNGTGWSDAVTLDLPTDGIPVWIRLKSKPGADEIIVATLDKGLNVSAAVWDGTAWGDNREATNDAVKSNLKPADVEFESTSGKAMATYAEERSDALYYRNWSAGSGWADESTGHNLGGEPDSGDLRPDPNSNDII